MYKYIVLATEEMEYRRGQKITTQHQEVHVEQSQRYRP
jgi:hypothetical protein